jgi:SAM-dependent methyltransferase
MPNNRSNSDSTLDDKGLSSRMQADWDRRIKHDYRFWMSESYADDGAMFKSGYRDLEILTADIVSPSPLTVMELGCGVGRILRAASEKFSHVHGLDVSKEGIAKARELLSDLTNVTLHLGDGLCIPLPNASLDMVYSFASLVCMPVDVIAGYLLEAHRVLKVNGTLRIQLYLGKEQPSAKSDTLSMRVFEEQNFIRAVQCAGFDVDVIAELQLPLQVSFEESGIKAVTAILHSTTKSPMAATDIARVLLPRGEGRAAGDLTDADLEYWMLLNYSFELLTKGEKEKGSNSYDEALKLEAGVTIDARELKEKISNLLPA